jgi:hypothetical protein
LDIAALIKQQVESAVGDLKATISAKKEPPVPAKATTSEVPKQSAVKKLFANGKYTQSNSNCTISFIPYTTFHQLHYFAEPVDKPENVDAPLPWLKEGMSVKDILQKYEITATGDVIAKDQPTKNTPRKRQVKPQATKSVTKKKEPEKAEKRPRRPTRTKTSPASSPLAKRLKKSPRGKHSRVTEVKPSKPTVIQPDSDTDSASGSSLTLKGPGKKNKQATTRSAHSSEPSLDLTSDDGLPSEDNDEVPAASSQDVKGKSGGASKMPRVQLGPRTKITKRKRKSTDVTISTSELKRKISELKKKGHVPTPPSSRSSFDFEEHQPAGNFTVSQEAVKRSVKKPKRSQMKQKEPTPPPPPDKELKTVRVDAQQFLTFFRERYVRGYSSILSYSHSTCDVICHLLQSRVPCVRGRKEAARHHACGKGRLQVNQRVHSTVQPQLVEVREPTRSDRG